MGILEQLEELGFRVINGKRRLLAQLDLGRTVFAKDAEGCAYRISAPGRLVSIEVTSDCHQDVMQEILVHRVSA